MISVRRIGQRIGILSRISGARIFISSSISIRFVPLVSLKEKIRKNDKEEFRDTKKGKKGRRGIYISEFYSQKSVRSKCTYLSQSLFPRTISTQFTQDYFFFHLINNFSMFVHLEKDERIKIGRRTDEMHV